MTPGERLIKIESVLFSTNGNKGLIQKHDEFYKKWWKWHDHERKQTCYYLNHEVKDMEKKKWTLTKITSYAKDLGVLVAIVTLILKLAGVF